MTTVTGASAGQRDEIVRRLPLSKPVLVLGALSLLVIAVALLSLGTGAVSISIERVARIILAGRAVAAGEPALLRDAMIVLDIRLPRTLAGLAIGAALAVSGALLQGLFRNPLADPTLVGVSSGSALAAALVIVLGHRFATGPRPLPFEILPPRRSAARSRRRCCSTPSRRGAAAPRSPPCCSPASRSPCSRGPGPVSWHSCPTTGSFAT